ncbi:hypothetical protein [Actinomadura alba]|uniref:Uncharacterized protein n=1 Tax=Actinomadura alba TaxID=406431 RepID=A0ABR7LHP5_9ACTN|nr:hypothetical protein [Actinomadura alba]MBC6464291.1 hypothetical protein [Actinomadura alba]
MDAREHFHAAEQYATDAARGGTPVGDTTELGILAVAHAVLAWAALLGADADPAEQIDTYDPATRAPVVSIAGRKTAAAADAPATAAGETTTRLPGRNPKS